MEYRNLEEVIEQVREGTGNSAVFGEPIHAEGRTVIPVARVVFGFGGGGTNESEREDEEEEESEEFGGGGGGVVTPLGIVEVTSAGTRFVRFGGGRRLLGAVLAGAAVGYLLGRR